MPPMLNCIGGLLSSWSDNAPTTCNHAINQQNDNGANHSADQSRTLAGAIPTERLAQKRRNERTDAFQIVKRAQPDRNDLGYRAASGPRWSDIGGANVGADFTHSCWKHRSPIYT